MGYWILKGDIKTLNPGIPVGSDPAFYCEGHLYSTVCLMRIVYNNADLSPGLGYAHF